MLNSKVITLGNFDLKLNHFLIIGILILSFSMSFLIRSQPAEFGFELNEFDPFFNFRATQYIVDNGIDAYFEWNDDLSWYPDGRNVSLTSQVILHLTAATTYSIFGFGADLYDYTIIFPVIISSFSAIVIFALVRVIGGTTAGLFATLLFSVSLPIIVRSPIGWFKSEPLGLFFSLLAVYLLLSGINSKNKKIGLVKLVTAGIFTSFSFSAWGGNQFFIIPLGIFFLTLPFLRTNHKFLIWAIPLYSVITMLVSLGFERLGANFVLGLGGMSLIIPTLIMIICMTLQMKSSTNKTRNALLVLLALLVVTPSLLILNSDSNLLPLPSYRYLNAMNPFLTTTDPLVDSVSEHATTTLRQSFTFHSILMVFSGLGIWLTIKNLQKNEFTFIKSDMLSFALILGIIGVYVSSTFVRLEVFASIAVIILASLGITALTKHFFSNRAKIEYTIGKPMKFLYALGIISLLTVPLVYPVDGNVVSLSTTSPTILNGGTSFPIATNDWLDALDWLKNNTPKDSVVASWWDYGYWISTVSDRATLSDNSTLSTERIQKIAKMFLSHPDQAWQDLEKLQADYVLVFVAGEKLQADSPESLYTLRGGGDESKKQWFMRIAGLDTQKFLHIDGISGTDYFWNETLLGKTFPFSVLAYVNPNNPNQQSPTFVPGMVPIYVKDIKFSYDENSPFRLVYASPSFVEENTGPMLGVFIYEVNKKYQPLR